VAVLLLDRSGPERLAPDLAWVPAKPWRLLGLTPITSFLVHAGWLHLLGNLYFLVTFGDNVEDRLGRGRFALLLVLSTLAGNLLHAWVDPRRELPCVGASGGISGLLACYAATWPWERIAVVFPRLYLFVRPGVNLWSVPAVVFLAFWAVWQLALAVFQSAGTGHVSAAAHVGGALAGIALWLAWRPRFLDRADG
jgi:membrane associated rhomboid family serine protease